MSCTITDEQIFRERENDEQTFEDISKQKEKEKTHNRMINLNIICMCDNRQTDMLFELVVINERK